MIYLNEIPIFYLILIIIMLMKDFRGLINPVWCPRIKGGGNI